MPPRLNPLKTLREAVHGPHQGFISVCAWVTWFSAIRQSSGSDHYMLLHLSDDSLSAEDMPAVRDPSRERQHDEPPYVTCFLSGAQHLLPQFDHDRPGLLYLHQTRVNKYNGERQLQVKLRPLAARGPDSDTFSVYSVTEASEGERVPAPLATSHPIGSIPLKQVNHPRIQEMRRWVMQRIEHRASSGANLPAATTSPGAKSRQQGGRNGLSAIRELVPPMAGDGVTPVAGPMPPANLICRVDAEAGAGDGDGAEATGVPSKRGRRDEAGTAVVAAAAAPRRHGLDMGGGGDDDIRNSAPPPPHCRRLHMPISSIAQFAGDLTATEAAPGGGGSDGAGDSGWEVLSAVLSGGEMPAVGLELGWDERKRRCKS
ncbi:hypothetical protein Vretimale_17175 [Volvox reticuliferus]|uniref:Uncharacterized protein n=1 Tax=Volvox reticuliferus TaxID=1737510 RepID=A0A8J4GVL6_9CHLO|nr:hypothetical protein Vretimale_17175 [Volvox reticuliferus]